MIGVHQTGENVPEKPPTNIFAHHPEYAAERFSLTAKVV